MSLLDEIKVKLALLRGRDPQYRLFGANVHRYRLSQTLSVAQVAAFEQEWQVRLPEGYRDFLLQVGGGGAGPYYGVLPLGYHKAALSLLREPFPHGGDWNEEHLSDDEYLDDSLTRGAMRICNTGSGGYELLVVTGAARGTIWADGRYANQGLLALPHSHNPLRRMDFLDWYLDWLERGLA
ncbi:MAG: SMI1/KNR4 family protein [Chloroflexi bacterium]|nr:SMI1/KNR4 family protein [Chloroflexota bacterium]